jgi:acyl carrier protein
MTDLRFTFEDLQRIMTAAAGDTDMPFDSAVLDQDFDDLGYDSLAMLEACGRIGREFGVTLDDSELVEAKTPRALIDRVNQHLLSAAAQLQNQT